LQLVLDVLGGEQRPVGEAAHVFRAVDDLEVAGRIEESGVARAHPATLEHDVPGGRLVLEVALEDTRAAIEHLALRRDLELDVFDRRADGIEPHVAVALDGDEDARLRHAIELLDVDPEAAEEDEDLGTDRLAGRVGAAHAPHAEVVAQRPVHEQPAQRTEQPAPRRNRASAQTRTLDVLGEIEEEAYEPALGPGTVLEAHHHGGEQALPDARWREEVRRSDLTQIGQNRGGALRTIDGKADQDRLRVG